MHFYHKLDDGAVQPRHYVEMSTKPGTRPTRMSDVRKAWGQGHAWVPSVTTALNTLAKPALDNWRIDQHLQVAARVPMGADLDAWVKSVKAATEMQMSEAPDAGTAFHDRFEQYIKTGEGDELCEAVYQVLVDKTGVEAWRSEVMFATDKYGGCADLVSDGWVIDLKTKQTADKFKPGRMAYEDHARQLAAYRYALLGGTGQSANIFVCLEDGQIDFHEHQPEALHDGWLDFVAALDIWWRRNA